MSLRKMLISGAAALLLTGPAVYAADCNPCTTDPNAVTLECDNTGDYLIAPLYYATGPWQTDLKVVNTNPNRAIVAKVVLREGTDCEEILDFLIYLTPGDVWTGTIYEDSDGIIKVKSDDDSFIIGGRQGTEVGSIGVHPAKEKKGDRVVNNSVGYVEIFGMVSYDPHLIALEDKQDPHWAPCSPLKKLLFYKVVNNNPNLSTKYDADDVSNDDLTGRVTIRTNASAVNDMRYMTLNMTAFGNFAKDAVTTNAYGADTALSNMTDKRIGNLLPQLDRALAKAQVNVLYEGNGDSLSPIRTHFTVPTKKYWYANFATMPSAYKLSDIYKDGRDRLHTAPSEYYYSLNPTGAEISVRDNSEHCNQCRKMPEISGAKQETCEIRVHAEVASFDNGSQVVKELAFNSGGWVSIDLTNNCYVADTGLQTVEFKGMPVIPTSFVAKEFKINGKSFYLNNWLYDSYKSAECGISDEEKEKCGL